MSHLQIWLQNHNRRLTQEAIDEALMEYIASVEKQRDELLTAVQAVIDRWDTPLWKNVPATGEYVNRLRHAVAAVKGGAV